MLARSSPPVHILQAAAGADDRRDRCAPLGGQFPQGSNTASRGYHSALQWRKRRVSLLSTGLRYFRLGITMDAAGSAPLHAR
jgi:hypothetical protein